MSSSLQAIKQRFGIIGASTLLDAALDTATRVAPTDLSVLIQGESGVGKEAFSKIIHSLSKRKHNSFIAINCGAIPEGTINSELFGHEKGAFTGAVSDRKGYFETVNGGTIFLDEIGEMPLDTQAMLLRILENGEYVRVGSSKVEKTDVRVIAATNIELEKAVQKGRFREDLFYRLSTVPIKVPSLKERSGDIYVLFRKFCVDFAEHHRIQPIQLDERARMLLERYTWPGNIRELKNVAERLSILSEERSITAEKLIDQMPHIQNRPLPTAKNGSNDENLDERDIMFKFLFDMKNDLNYLKTVIAELIKNNNLTAPNSFSINNMGLPSPSRLSRDVPSVQRPDFGRFEPKRNHFPNDDDEYVEELYPELDGETDSIYNPKSQHIIIQNPHNGAYSPEVVAVDASLNLADKEKEIIVLALKKHNGRRKEASDDLGISERTLYRKIKDYGLD
jgi:DNA-binding NtrC family response regulator